MEWGHLNWQLWQDGENMGICYTIFLQFGKSLKFFIISQLTNKQSPDSLQCLPLISHLGDSSGTWPPELWEVWLLLSSPTAFHCPYTGPLAALQVPALLSLGLWGLLCSLSEAPPQTSPPVGFCSNPASSLTSLQSDVFPQLLGVLTMSPPSPLHTLRGFDYSGLGKDCLSGGWLTPRESKQLALGYKPDFDM